MAFYAAGAYGKYDKNISPLLRKFEVPVKYLSDYLKAGYLVSYQALGQEASMEREKCRLSDDYLRRLFIRRSDEEVKGFLKDLIQPLKQVKDGFTFAVHAKHFGEYECWIGWRRFYESSLETLKNSMAQGMERTTD